MAIQPQLITEQCYTKLLLDVMYDMYNMLWNNVDSSIVIRRIILFDSADILSYCTKKYVKKITNNINMHSHAIYEW